ncbi:MAG: hypothetical protein VW576_10275 [Opitutae bacterium]
MDISTYIGIAVGLVLALLFWKVDDFFDRVLGWFLNPILNPIFSLIGLDSAGGPFTSKARELDNCIELVIQKEGSGKAAPAAILVTGSGNQKAYPVPYFSEEEANQGVSEKNQKELRKQLTNQKISQGEKIQVFISKNELSGASLSSIAVMDKKGKNWPVTLS